MSSILLSKIGNTYPKVRTEVHATENETSVAVRVILSPNHVDLDYPSYIETKWKKQIPALKGIGVLHDDKTSEQQIYVAMQINGKYNSVDDINSLAEMAKAIATIAEERLSEPEVIKNIGADCKPWFDEEEKSCDNA